MYTKALLFVLAVFTLGVGPCDMLEGDEEDTDGDAGETAYCTEMGCIDSLNIEVIRADNAAFLTGSYQIEVIVPDETSYAIECYLAYVEAGLECSTIDLGMIFAFISPDGQTILITLFGVYEAATVTVKFNEFAIGRRTLRLAYQEFFPNGSECPPVCNQATESIAVESW